LNSSISTEIQKLNEAKSKYLDNRRKLDEERTKHLEKAVKILREFLFNLLGPELKKK